MIPYILHVTVITTVCFLFYKLLLQKETFYQLNRWTLMGCLAISFTLPLLPAPRDWSLRDSWRVRSDQPVAPPVAQRAEPVPDMVINDWKPAVSEPTAPVHRHTAAARRRTKLLKQEVTAIGTGLTADRSKETTTPDAGVASTIGAGTRLDGLLPVLQWLFYLYLFGLVVFGGNFLLQVVVLLYQSYARPVIRDGRFRIVEISGNRAPCSFGNTIFINPANYDWDTYNQILIHEKTHVSGRHTLDILLAEMAVVLQWFNPFAWLYRREVENNLEFLTDASVLEHRDVERSAYQLSLLRVSAPHLPFSITNNYNQSLLKRRIVMMNSKQSSLHTVWKYFFLIPLLTGLVCALNKPAAYGAVQNNGPLAGDGGTRIRTEKSIPGADALADTTKKPRNDSSRLRHDSLAGVERPALSTGSERREDRADDATLAQQKYLDEALHMTQGSADTSLEARAAMNEKLAQEQIAQLDMAATTKVKLNEVKINLENVKLNMEMDKKLRMEMTMPMVKVQPNVDVNVGDIRIAGDTDLLEGAWFATSFSSDTKIRFELKRESENGSWNNSFGVEKSEFNPYPGQGNVEFKLTREAGTITFKGQFDGQEGFGHFRFTPDEAYFKALKEMGIDDLDGRRFAFFTVNVKKDYVLMLQHAFPHLSTHELISCAAQHIDQDFIKYWQGTGIADLDNPRSLISLKSLRIDRAYVDELKAAGYDHLQLRELLSLKSQHIDGAYLRSLGKTRDNEVIPVRDVISYKSMHIDSAYIASLRNAGYSNLDRNQLFSMYSQHVSAEFIKGFQDLGYKDMSARELVNLKAIGVTPEFVREFNKIGFDHIPMNMLGMLKSTGVNAEYVSKMKEKGFVSKDLGKYIRLKNDFN